ncbi:LacI family DNA-binding transcriptional regulator [Mucilaginibacter sp. UR6-11]|uniref:LacI family DNA-binding transcriptional regulator n=1 Tax=Mucilaginibacter sp. UR6-11 TaxID=1435644 RepID=UPI001E336ED5|nr:substrate-binding domain-containing protein [Mucilaginibacter sp. UR6-11]MCC8423481.1 substrate-binding domain-containing protein [Mucilaginibacter sp. UR6-11]
MIKKRISIKDIAKLTNTSITTVSFVLNGKGRISKEISEKILEVANANGYEPNRMAVGLRTGSSKVIGFIVEAIGGPFFGAMAKVIEEEAEKAGYGVIYCSTNNNIQKGKDAIRMLSRQQVDGYIITPLKGLEKEVQDLVARDKPVVLIDGYFPDLDIPHVLVDNYNSSYEAVEFLIKSGYRNIGLVTADAELIQLQDRTRGYSDALKANGLKNEEKVILKIPFDADRDKAVKATKAFIKKQKQIDALFFSTNYLGIMGLQSITELNLNIPGNLAMVSFDDNEIFDFYPPGITTVKQPAYEIAKSAIDIVLSQMGDKKPNISKIKLLIPAEIIKRGSTITLN